MSNEHKTPLNSHEGRISQNFEVNAEFEYPYYPHLTVSDNARAQIDNEALRQNAIEKHDFNWKLERDKLSNSTVPFPNNDLSSREHRSLQHEYEERRANWEYVLASIENKHNNNRDYIREEGQTLSQEFSVQNDDNGMSITNNSFQVEIQNEQQKAPLKQEFSVRSNDANEQNFTVSKNNKAMTMKL